MGLDGKGIRKMSSVSGLRYVGGWYSFCSNVTSVPAARSFRQCLQPLGGGMHAGVELALFARKQETWNTSRPDRMAVTLHTDLGDIKIEVFCERAPKASENFLALCASNYYTGCLFHRNIKGFMVQTGDPTGTGKGGISIWGRKFEDEFSEFLKHSVRGVVSMANSGPNTNGSQFFITYGKQPHLDMKYTVFGKVIDGLETLDELEKLPVNEKNFRPLTEVRIKDITLHANPFAG